MRDGGRVGDLEAGIIAQELDAAAKAHGAEWMDLVCHIDSERLQATPHKLLFPLIKAVQELLEIARVQGQTIVALEDRLRVSSQEGLPR